MNSRWSFSVYPWDMLRDYPRIGTGSYLHLTLGYPIIPSSEGIIAVTRTPSLLSIKRNEYLLLPVCEAMLCNRGRQCPPP